MRSPRLVRHRCNMRIETLYVSMVFADFDSATPRFESWRPSHPVRSPTYFPATPRNWRKALKPRSLSLPESARCTAIASAGDQVNPQNPRRWALVRRELPISTGELGASQWSVDHVFLDQDGIPTLVEIKRQSDSRVRREVVGQMLDYAANCITYWSAESLRTAFEATCGESGQPYEAVLSEHIGEAQ